MPEDHKLYVSIDNGKSWDEVESLLLAGGVINADEITHLSIPADITP